MNFVFQTRFGGVDSSPSERGNCDAACVSTITGIPLDEIPPYQEHGENGWFEERQKFLKSRGLFSVIFDARFLSSENSHIFPNGLCIAVGPAPRGDWNHAVVGCVTDGKLKLIHDPYPNGSFFNGGECILVEYIFKLLDVNLNVEDLL